MNSDIVNKEIKNQNKSIQVFGYKGLNQDEKWSFADKQLNVNTKKGVRNYSSRQWTKAQHSFKDALQALTYLTLPNTSTKKYKIKVIKAKKRRLKTQEIIIKYYLAQVYANLFSNAFKYAQGVITDQGQKVKYVAYGRETVQDFFGPGKDGIKYNVFSTGPHIPQEDQDRIFEEGYRGTNSSKRPLFKKIG